MKTCMDKEVVDRIVVSLLTALWRGHLHLLEHFQNLIELLWDLVKKILSSSKIDAVCI